MSLVQQSRSNFFSGIPQKKISILHWDSYIHSYPITLQVPVYHKIDFSEMKREENTEKRLYVKTMRTRTRNMITER